MQCCCQVLSFPKRDKNRGINNCLLYHVVHTCSRVPSNIFQIIVPILFIYFIFSLSLVNSINNKTVNNVDLILFHSNSRCPCVTIHLNRCFRPLPCKYTSIYTRLFTNFSRYPVIIVNFFWYFIFSTAS